MHRQTARLRARTRMLARQFVAIIAVAVFAGVSARSVEAQNMGSQNLGAQNTAARSAAPPLVIRSDRGGYLGKRRAEIARLRASGQRVELRGTCLSACTLYLSLPNACIAPKASFGFHGPSKNGVPLSQPQFDYWSEVMASNYAEPLASWFMSVARYNLTGYYRLTGAQLIAMGYASC